MPLPTATRCIDGKGHKWERVGYFHEFRYGYVRTFKRCKLCGCHTEFLDEKRCKEPDGSYYIEIPQVYKKYEVKKRRTGTSQTFQFLEPHVTGGNSLVTVTKTDIIKYMHNVDERYKNMPENKLVGEFCAIHFAWRV